MSDNHPERAPEGNGAPPNGQAATPASPGEERVALLLKSLPGELTESVLGRIGPERAVRLRECMRVGPPASSPEARQVLRGFVERVRQISALSGDGKDSFVPSTLAKAILGAVDTAPVAPSRALAGEAEGAAAPEPEGDPIEDLKGLGAARTAAALRGERTPTVVATLSNLEMNEVGEILKRLPPEQRREATLRLARGASGDEETRRAVARAVVRRGRALGDDPAALEADGEARKLAELLRGLERDDRKEVLEGLEKSDPATAEKVKKLLYVFEDLLKIEDRSVQALLGEVELKTLAMALAGAADTLMTKVMNNLSQRARDTLTEEMGLLGKPRATQIREAREQVVTVIQRLDGEGKLVILED
jgi:flagellar motor switch protein FliG